MPRCCRHRRDTPPTPRKPAPSRAAAHGRGGARGETPWKRERYSFLPPSTHLFSVKFISPCSGKGWRHGPSARASQRFIGGGLPDSCSCSDRFPGGPLRAVWVPQAGGLLGLRAEFNRKLNPGCDCNSSRQRVEEVAFWAAFSTVFCGFRAA